MAELPKTKKNHRSRPSATSVDMKGGTYLPPLPEKGMELKESVEHDSAILCR